MPGATVLGAVSLPDGRYAVEPIVLGPLQSGEARIRVLATGMCRTDAEAFHMLPLPAVLGHESVGDVIELHGDAGDLRIGDRVAVSYPSCGGCSPCKQGDLWLCDQNWALSFDGHRADGTRPIQWRGEAISSAFFQQSSFATEAIVPIRSLVKVPRDIPVEVVAALPCGQLTGSGAVTNVLKIPSGGSCAVIGAGAVGLSAVMTARICGAESILTIDIHPERLRLSQELGATHAVDAGSPNAADEVHRAFPDGIPLILDTTGSAQAWSLAMSILARGGKFAFVTTPEPVEEYGISPFELFLKVGTMTPVLLGAALPREQIPLLLAWWSEGLFPIERLVRTYPLAEINMAAADAAAGRTIKPVIIMPARSRGGNDA